MGDTGESSFPPSQGDHEVPIPWLVYTHTDDIDSKYQTFCNVPSLHDPKNNNKSHTKSIPALRDKYIFACCSDGWLVLRDLEDERVFSLWNTASSSSQTISLPNLEVDNINNFTTCGLITSHEDLVMVLFKKGVVFSCRLKSDGTSTRTWAQQNIEIDGRRKDIEIHKVVSCNGVLYGCCLPCCGIVKIEIASDESNSIPLTIKSLGLGWPSFGPCVHSGRIEPYLVESCGQLYLIWTYLRLENSKVIQEIMKVVVWEIDLSQMQWVEVESLGNRTFFQTTNCSTWCWASDGVQGNCIYFVFDTVFLYKMQDDSFAMLLPCSDLKPFEGPLWVMPPPQRSFLTRETSKIPKIHNVDNFDQGTNMKDHLNPEQVKQNERSLCQLPDDNNNALPFPLFMFNKNNEGLYELKDISTEDSLLLKLPCLPRAPSAIEFSKDGWLILCRDENEACYFFNVFTKEKMSLPFDENMHGHENVGFSTSPTSSDCVTVRMDQFITEFSSMHYGDETWQYHDQFDGLLEDGNNFEPYRCCPLFHKGAFYFLDMKGYLGKFRLQERKASWELFTSRIQHDYEDDVHSCHLVECDGEIISVFIGKLGRWIKVLRFDTQNNGWIELESLGNHMLFISISSCYSVLATDKRMANRIYLPWLKGNDVVFYSLETRKYHTRRSEEAMEDFHHMEGHSLCCWVKPS